MVFTRIAAAKAAPAVCIRVDGQPIRVQAGLTVAAALLLAGRPHLRIHPVTGRGRAPYCLMGCCFECEIKVGDGRSERACMLPVSEGLAVRTR